MKYNWDCQSRKLTKHQIVWIIETYVNNPDRPVSSIAEELNVDPETVRSYIENVLGLNNFRRDTEVIVLQSKINE